MKAAQRLLTKYIPYRFLKWYAISQIKKHGFWYIDIPRTSSTSIKTELAGKYGITYGKSSVMHHGHSYPQIFQDHLPAVTMRRIIGDHLWSQIFTFTLVRNPWDRLVSSYNYRKETGDLPEKYPFKDYIKWFRHPQYGLKVSPHYYFGYYYNAADYILDQNGKMIVDSIGYYEKRKEFLAEIAKKLRLPDLGKTHLQGYTSTRKHYSLYYDEESIDIVNDICCRDIELFQYTFEDKRPHG